MSVLSRIQRDIIFRVKPKKVFKKSEKNKKVFNKVGGGQIKFRVYKTRKGCSKAKAICLKCKRQEVMQNKQCENCLGFEWIAG